MTETVSIASARRIALAAQGFGREVPASVGTRQLTGTLDRLGVLQIDSVNVWERSHYLPVFARLGAYDKSLLDAITLAPRARYLEYWGHEATFMRREMLPLFQWRMDHYRDRALAGSDGWVRENRATLDWLLAEIGRGGPRAASDIEHEDNVRQGPWWGWSDVKRGLEVLFRSGELVSAGRKGFERRYALPAQVLPAEITSRVVAKPDAIRELVAHAARAHGIGTLDDIADYFRLPSADTRDAIRDLVDAGELLPVTVEGWSQGGKPRPAWLHRDARRPRRMDVDALLSPFDPVVWARSRALRLFDFHYRIEIYTPEPKRVHGYCVQPVLIDGIIAGRVDLKNDRQSKTLLVQSAWREPSAPPETAEKLAALLRRAAEWQGLERISVRDRGTLSSELRAALGDALTH